MYLDDLLDQKWNIDTSDGAGIFYCHIPEVNDDVYLRSKHKVGRYKILRRIRSKIPTIKK